MDEVRLNTPSIVKLGSFAGKIKYCLIDAFVIPLIKNLKLKIKLMNNRLIVMINNGSNEMPLHVFIWKYVYQSILPQNVFIAHRNGITMDNRLENLFLTFHSSFSLSPLFKLSTFYWHILSNLPIDMDEIDYHHSNASQSSLYECHYSPCTELLVNTSDEQFSCFQCKRIKYCSHFCRTMDMNIHSVFCNPLIEN